MMKTSHFCARTTANQSLFTLHTQRNSKQEPLYMRKNLNCLGNWYWRKCSRRSLGRYHFTYPHLFFLYLTHLIQFKIVHRVHYSNEIVAKLYHNVAPEWLGCQHYPVICFGCCCCVHCLFLSIFFSIICGYISITIVPLL